MITLTDIIILPPPFRLGEVPNATKFAPLLGIGENIVGLVGSQSNLTELLGREGVTVTLRSSADYIARLRGSEGNRTLLSCDEEATTITALIGIHAHCTTLRGRHGYSAALLGVHGNLPALHGAEGHSEALLGIHNNLAQLKGKL